VGYGLISDEIINQIKDRVDIAEVVGHHVNLVRGGQNLKGLCPFHQEKTPSFTVSPSRQIFHCFGCGAGGNVFTFLTRITGASFPEVVRDLAAKVGVDVPDSSGPERQTPAAAGRLEQLNLEAGQWFRRQLADSAVGQEARSYLERRGIQPATIERFGLGYARSEWDSLVEAMTKAGYRQDELILSGLAAPRDAGGRGRSGGAGCYDRFRGRVMFPIMDVRRRVVGFGGRVLDEQGPKYLNSPETPLFKKGTTLYGLDLARSAVTAAQTLVIVEGYFDVVALHQAGITHVVGTLGTALTPEHVQTIRRFAHKVILLFDPDPAGVRAALRTLDLFVNSGLSVKVVSLPPGDDPDTFVRARGAGAFLQLQAEAPSLLDFSLERKLEGADRGSIEERIRTVDEILRILQKSEHPIERDERFRLVAERMRISHQRLIERYPALRAQEPKRTTRRESPVLPAGSIKVPAEERDLVYLLLQGRLQASDLSSLTAEMFTVPSLRRLVESALRHLGVDGRVALQDLLDEAVNDPDCAAVATELSLLDRHYDDERTYIRGCLDRMARKRSDARLRDLIEQLKAAERDGRNDDARSLNAQVNELRSHKAGAAAGSSPSVSAKE
jgi:DNA primase